MPKKVVLLNDLYPELDEDMNGEFYKKETEDTGVVYRIENIYNGKSYIGRTCSYGSNGRRKCAKCRFVEHWNKKSRCGSKCYNDCPIFYEPLRNSNLEDWFVFTLKVCDKKDLKNLETEFIKLYNTSDPEYGYNYFVGNNKPNNEQHLKTYQDSKAKTNASRASNSVLKRTDTNKKLPTYISYYCNKNDGKLVCEGYLVRIKINGKQYQKRFLSTESMKIKLAKAIKQLELFKKEAQNKNTGSKTNKRKKKILPMYISHYTSKNGVGNPTDGYIVRIKINGKQYQKKFLAMTVSMETKFELAKKQIELFKKEAEKDTKNKIPTKQIKKLIEV